MKDLLSIVLITEKDTHLNFIQTLESAINQTYPEREIFVVNANVPEDPFSLGLSESLAQYSTVYLLQADPNETNSFYRNLALNRISGEYVIFLKCKEILEPYKAALQIEQLKIKDSAAASCSNGTVVFENPRNVTSESLFDEISYDKRRWLLEKPVRTGAQVIYRTEALRFAGGFDEQFKFYSDIDMLMRLVNKNDVLFFPVAMFETSVPDDMVWLRTYEDERILSAKYEDLFLLNRRARYNSSLLVAKQAYKSHLGLRTISDYSKVFFNEPLYSLFSLLHAVMHTVSIIGKLLKNFCTSEITAKKRIYSLYKHKSLDSDHSKRSDDSLQTKNANTKCEMDNVFSTKEFSSYRMFQLTGNNMLSKMTIPDNITVIKRGMFLNCENLTSIAIPNTVTRIEAQAFHNCRKLDSIFFQHGSKLTVIGAYAFAGCVSLTDVELPGSILQIEKGAFAGCTQLRNISFSYLNGNEEIVSQAFPSSLIEIPNYAFANCNKMQSIIFEEGTTLDRIGIGAFFNCSELELVYLTGGLRKISSFAFAGCVKLNKLYIRLIDAISEIGFHAFENCHSLSTVHIPTDLKRIRAGTYLGCSDIKNVRIPVSVHKIDHKAFSECSNLRTVVLMNKDTLYFPSSFPPDAIIEKYNPDFNI